MYFLQTELQTCPASLRGSPKMGYAIIPKIPQIGLDRVLACPASLRDELNYPQSGDFKLSLPDHSLRDQNTADP